MFKVLLFRFGRHLCKVSIDGFVYKILLSLMPVSVSHAPSVCCRLTVGSCVANRIASFPTVRYFPVLTASCDQLRPTVCENLVDCNWRYILVYHRYLVIRASIRPKPTSSPGHVFTLLFYRGRWGRWAETLNGKKMAALRTHDLIGQISKKKV